MITDIVDEKRILWKRKRKDDTDRCRAVVIIVTNSKERPLLGELELLWSEITDTFPNARKEDLTLKRSKCFAFYNQWLLVWKVPEPGLPIKYYEDWCGKTPPQRNSDEERGSVITFFSKLFFS